MTEWLSSLAAEYADQIEMSLRLCAATIAGMVVGINRDIHNKPIVVKAGRFGPYVTDGETNATLPRTMAAEAVTLAEAVELLKARRAAGPSKKSARGRKAPAKKAPARKAAAKAPAAKKTAAKKTAAKKAAPKKAAAKKTAAKKAPAKKAAKAG